VANATGAVERIDKRVDHRRTGPDRTRLAGALDAQALVVEGTLRVSKSKNGASSARGMA
jgi:hypothetical protein